MHGEREAWVVKWGNRDLVTVEELILHARIKYFLNDLEFMLCILQNIGAALLPVVREIGL